MLTFEIFSYWNVRELQLVFNAVAAIVGSSDYLGLMRTIALVGLLSMAMAVLAGFSQLPDFGRWVIMLAVFNGMLLVPKVSVVITDRTGTQPSVTVANVPIGLASFAHSVSHVGDWLTRTFETTFSLPADIQFRSNGTLWGHRVQQEILHTKFDNSILTSNLMEFYRECVVPEYATGYIVASDMAKTNDIWTYLNGRTNPGRLVTIRAVPGSTPVAGTYGCDGAYGFLTTQILAVNTQQMNTLGNRLYPGLPTAAANAAVQSTIQTSTNYMLGISKTAMDTVKQTAMSNFMIDAQYLLPAQIGDAAGAAANLAQAQAIRSTSDSYKMMSKLSESTMPKVKNIVEIVQYSVFPIIMLLVLLAGHKGGLVLKGYVMSLVWVQLWPPLYAVMHLVMTMHAQDLAAMTSGLGLSMSQYSMVNNAYISDEAIAGMIAATAIPAIAAAIVKGGDVGAQAIAGMTTPAREAERIASGMSAGNTQMGNASLGNQSADNLSMMQYNASPTIRQGGFNSTGADNVGNFYGMENGKATHLVNNTAAFQNIGAKVGLSGRTSGSLQTASENSERAALADTTIASNSMTAARSASSSFERGHGKSINASTSDTLTGAAQFMTSFGQEQALTDKFAKEHGLNQTQMAQVSAFARAEASGGLNTPFGGATVSGGVETKGTSSSATSQTQKLAHELANKKDYKEAVTKTNTAAHSSSFTQGDESTVRAATGVRSSLDNSLSNVQSAQSSHEKAVAFKEAATRTKEMGASYDTNHMNEFMDWMRGQNNPTSGKTFTANDVEAMSRYAPENLSQYAQKFSDEKLVPEIEKTMPAPTNGVAAQHEQNQATVPGTQAVSAFDAKNNKEVGGLQATAGVIPGTAPANNVAGQVQAMTGQATAAIGAGKGEVHKEGEPIKTRAENSTDPTKGSNLGRAAANALPVALGSDATKLADRAGLIPDDAGVAKPVADQNTGTLTENIVGTAIAVGLTVGGGAGGKLLGNVGGKILGREAGDVAQATALKVAAKTEERVASQATKAEGGVLKAETAAAPEATAASKVAADKAKENIERSAARKGAEADVGTASTLQGVGMISGAIAGGGIAKGLSGEEGVAHNPAVQPVLQAVENTNNATLEAVSDVANKANNLGNKIADTINKK